MPFSTKTYGFTNLSFRPRSAREKSSEAPYSNMFKEFFISFSIISALFLSPIYPNHQIASAYTETNLDKQKIFKVEKVVDGDTIKVNIRGNIETVRLLGIDTPEIVDHQKSVQCFAKTASDKMKKFILGKYVKLIDDSTQGNRDRYGRLLRYVYLLDNKATFVNGEMIKQGYAFSYKKYPTKMLVKFNKLEKYARSRSLGLWSSCPTNKN